MGICFGKGEKCDHTPGGRVVAVFMTVVDVFNKLEFK